MEKRKLYPIGKAAEICKVSPRALRYYEEKGLIRLEGKDYVVQDGDIMLFRFNV